MGIVRAKNLPEKIYKNLGSVIPQPSVDKFVRSQIENDMAELKGQVMFLYQDGWQKIKAKFEAHIVALKEDIITMSKNTYLNSDEIQRTNDLLRTMTVFMEITNNIVTTYNRTKQEGEALKPSRNAG